MTIYFNLACVGYFLTQLLFTPYLVLVTLYILYVSTYPYVQANDIF